MARCTSRSKQSGIQCKKSALRGATVCNTHGGSAPQVRNKAAILTAVAQWSDGDTPLDPFDILSRAMTVTWLQRERHAAALDGLVAEHTWVGAFVGDTFVVSDDGRPTKVGEYARSLATWEQKERLAAADLALKMIGSGLAERYARVLEAHTRQTAESLRRGLEDAGLGDRVQEVLGYVGRHLRLVAG